MTYGSETTKTDGNMLAVTKRALERKMLGVTFSDHVNSQLSVKEVTWKHIVVATVRRNPLNAVLTTGGPLGRLVLGERIQPLGQAEIKRVGEEGGSQLKNCAE